MPTIDLPTLFVVSTALFVLMSVMFFVTWRQDRVNNRAMLPWSAAHALGVPACLLMSMRGEIAPWASVGLSNTLIILGYGLVLAGARMFEGRPTRPSWTIAGAAIWVAACQIPAFWETFGARVTLISSLITTYTGLSAVLIWRGRRTEPLPTRAFAAGVLALIAATHLARMLMTMASPPTESFAALGSGWVGFIALQILFQTVLAGYALVSLVKERGEFQQRRTAEVDSLTGVLTRRAFIERATARLAADPTRGALLIFDLDRFKRINDTHGHLAGDRVLGEFAATVSARVSGRDVFGRFGGEEFALFLVDADLAAGWRAAEDIRRDFAARDIRHGERPIRATVSVGVAAVPLIEPDLDRLLASADAGLYAAKQSGRDRVETAAGEATGVPVAVAKPRRRRLPRSSGAW